MYEENHVIKVRSKERLFGEFVEATVLLGSKKCGAGRNSDIERVIIDFKKHPAYIVIKHGNCKTKMKQLNSLEDKKLLVGKNNLKSLIEADDYIDAITFEGAISCFDKFPIDLDFERASKSLGVPPSCSYRDKLNVYVAMGDMYVFGKKLKNLTEASLLSSFKKNSRIYTPQEGKIYIKELQHYAEIDTSKFKTHERYCINAIRNRYAYALRNFGDIPIDTSGSFRSYKSALKYLNIGHGFVPIRTDSLDDLKQGKRPSIFNYRDAKDGKDKLAQPINLGTSGKYFVTAGTDNAVVVGYTDVIVDKIMSYYNPGLY